MPAGSREGIREAHRAFWCRYPTQFLYHELGVSLWRRQADIVRALRENPRVAVRSCNGAGKTFAAACAVIWWLLSFADSIAVTTAPTDHQVRDLLWREIRGLYRRNAALIGGAIRRSALDITERHYAVGLSTDTPERLQGFHSGNILFVVDEASGVREEIYEAIEGCMTSSRVRLLLIGNPTSRTGTFFRAFHTQRGLWHAIHISAFDTPNVVANEVRHHGLVTRRWVDDAATVWGGESPLYQIRVLGDFPTASTNTLIPLRLVEPAVRRRRGAPESGPVSLGDCLTIAARGETPASLRRNSSPPPFNWLRMAAIQRSPAESGGPSLTRLLACLF